MLGVRVHALRPSALPSPRSRVLANFETEPTFRPLNVGSGLVRVHATGGVVATAACQFAAFGPSKFGEPQPLTRAEPLTAHERLHCPLEGAIVLVSRGLCSIESKMRTAAAAGASGVILMNDEEDTFLAAPDPPPAFGDAAPRPAHCEHAEDSEPSALEDSVEPIPLVVVSASSAARISAAYESEEQAGADVSISVTMLAHDDAFRDALRLPLFPVAKTLLPGQILRMRVSRAERIALQTRFQLALNAPAGDSELPSDIGVATVAVVLVGDASTNLLASVGIVASTALTVTITLRLTMPPRSLITLAHTAAPDVTLHHRTLTHPYPHPPPRRCHHPRHHPRHHHRHRHLHYKRRCS